MNNSKKLNALVGIALAKDAGEKELYIQQLKEAASQAAASPVSGGAEGVVRDLLFELGCPENLIGYEYAVHGILLALKDRACVDGMTKVLYPRVAEAFQTTPSRTERAIRHLIEVTCERTDLDALAAFFGNTISADRGKPTNGEFIARMTNLARRRMQSEEG